MSFLQQTIERIPHLDLSLLDKAQAHLDSQTKPRGSLGQLERVACRMLAIAAGALAFQTVARWTGSVDPSALKEDARD